MRIKEHFEGLVRITAGYPVQLLRMSRPLRLRTDARRFDLALKSYIRSRIEGEFERCIGLCFALGTTLLELGPRGRRPRL